MSNQKQNALADYVQVNVRIEKFWELHPNGRIQTELVSWNDGVVIMKAFVYKDVNSSVPSAEGMAYEKEGSSFINKTSALENCETSAVGRALAILGFEIKKSVASYEEVANAKLNQNKEVQEEPINAQQVGMVKVNCKSIASLKKVDDVEVLKSALGNTSATYETLTTLSKEQATKLLEKLDKWRLQAEEKKEPVENEECRQCDGTGYVRVALDGSMQCGACGGTGKKKVVVTN